MIPVGSRIMIVPPEYGGGYPSLAGLGADLDFGGWTGDGGGGGGDSSFWSNLANAIGFGTQAATGIIAATRAPYVLPGTSNVLYDPYTRNVTTPAGVTASTIGWGLGPMLAIGGIGLVALLLIAKK